jgi:hypothetical protein
MILCPQIERSAARLGVAISARPGAALTLLSLCSKSLRRLRRSRPVLLSVRESGVYFVDLYPFSQARWGQSRMRSLCRRYVAMSEVWRSGRGRAGRSGRSGLSDGMTAG